MFGRTLLHVAAEAADLHPRPRGLEVVEVLLRHGANASRPDSRGESPLSAAARVDAADVEGALVRAAGRSFIDLPDFGGRTALHHAAKAGSRGCARVLVIHGARTDLRDHDGLTPLAYAEREGYPRVGQVILSAPFLRGNLPAEANSSVSPDLNRLISEEPVLDADDGIVSSEAAAIIGVVTGTIVVFVAICLLRFCAPSRKKGAVVAPEEIINVREASPRNVGLARGAGRIGFCESDLHVPPRPPEILDNRSEGCISSCEALAAVA